MSERVRIANVDFTSATEEDLVRASELLLTTQVSARLVTPNLDIARLCYADQVLREIVNSADLVVADGWPIKLVSVLNGTPLPEVVPGADFMWRLIELAEAKNVSVVLIGSQVDINAAESAITRRYEAVLCVTVPVGVISDPWAYDLTEIEKVLERQENCLVLTGLGFPKQDVISWRLARCTRGAFFVGVGAGIAFAGGRLARAPLFVRRIGMEWLFRLACEPRRLFRRYILEDAPFLIMLAAKVIWCRLLRR